MKSIKNKKQYKKYLIMLLIILLIALLSVSFYFLFKHNNEITKLSDDSKKETNNLDIIYHIEGNNSDIRCCIKFNSSLSNIEYIITPDENTIYPNKKNIAIDYKIESEKDYLFKIKCEGESEYLYTITNKQEQYPKISRVESRNYALITEDGIIVDKYTIDFGGTSHNYYSIDEGKTWIEYTGGLIDIKKDGSIIAKTMDGKNSLNKISITKLNLASDALGSIAYDGSIEEKSMTGWGETKRIDVSEEMWNEDINVYINVFWNNGPVRTYFYDENENNFKNNHFTIDWGGYTSWKTIKIPQNTKYIKFQTYYSSGLYEIEPIIKN